VPLRESWCTDVSRDRLLDVHLDVRDCRNSTYTVHITALFNLMFEISYLLQPSTCSLSSVPTFSLGSRSSDGHTLGLFGLDKVEHNPMS
jgi:hypothetical protein